VRAALAKLDDPVLDTVGFARLLELPTDALGLILEQAVGLEDLALRRAVVACTKLDPETSRERAVALLKEDTAPPRRLGLALLGALGAEDDLPLIRSGLTDRDPSVRAEAVYDVALVRGDQALEELAPLLDDPEETVRLAVLGAALKVGKPEDGPLLLPGLEDRDEDVRTQTLLALGSMKAREETEAVTSLVADPSPQVRGAVAVALEGLAGDRPPEALFTLSRDPTPRVRGTAAAALGRWSDEERVLTLLFRLAGDDSLMVARVAYRVLVDSRRRDVLPFFISELSNERPSWALDPLPPEPAGSAAKPVPFGALAACALRWLTGKEFGYQWRASAEDRLKAQRRWREWLASAGEGDDLTHAPQPAGLTSYEQLLRKIALPSSKP